MPGCKGAASSNNAGVVEGLVVEAPATLPADFALVFADFLEVEVTLELVSAVFTAFGEDVVSHCQLSPNIPHDEPSGESW